MNTFRFLFAFFLLASSFSLFATPPSRKDIPSNDKIDASIRRGLDFIARGQIETGSFDSSPARAYAGIPALCGMAFLAAGETPNSEPYGPVILRIVDHLTEIARKDDSYMGVNGGKMYSHCIATLFLSEISGMVNSNYQAKIDALLPKATKLILNAQAVQKAPSHSGGWRYEPNSTDSDMSCSGWALMALRSARLNGAPVPEESIQNAVNYLFSHHNAQTGSFGYQDTNGNAQTLTGAGLLCLELCGKHGDPATLRAASYIDRNYLALQSCSYRLYGLYYASQGLFQIGGDSWKSFSDWMYSYWIPLQKNNGCWDVGEAGCPYYQTALVVLSLTVPYRQLPIYQRDETVDAEE